jgi:4-alpha-glucanotransferase
LPLGPTGYGDSPYACYSAFAGNTLLISPEKLFEEGLLARSDLDEIPSLPTERVDFERVQQSRDIILAKAFASYQRTTSTELRSALETFAAQNAFWLDDYALRAHSRTAARPGTNGTASWFGANRRRSRAPKSNCTTGLKRKSSFSFCSSGSGLR